MAQEITMPALGESVTEGTITVWLKKVGDAVEIDEPIVEVSTDKVDTEVPSPVAGVISEIVAQEDETVEVGAVLAYVGDGDELGESTSAESNDASDAATHTETCTDNADVQRPAEPPLASLPTPPEPQWAEKPIEQAAVQEPAAELSEPKPVHTESAAVERADAAELPADSAPFAAQYLTPIVRKLAKDLHVDLASVKGTGVGGRIRRQDVEAAAESIKTQAAEHKIAADAGDASVLSARDSSLGTSPSPTSVPVITVEVDGTDLAYNFLPAVLKAAHNALTEYPALLSGHSGSTSPVCAVTLAATRGAFMPIVPNLAESNEDQIAAAVAEVSARAAAGNIGPDDLIGSNFSIIDNTAQGIMLEIPQIQPCHTAALSVGARELRAKVMDENGTIAARRTFFLSLAYDPSAADAHIASEFLKRVKSQLESSPVCGG